MVVSEPPSGRVYGKNYLSSSSRFCYDCSLLLSITSNWSDSEQTQVIYVPAAAFFRKGNICWPY